MAGRPSGMNRHLQLSRSQAAGQPGFSPTHQMPALEPRTKPPSKQERDGVPKSRSNLQQPNSRPSEPITSSSARALPFAGAKQPNGSATHYEIPGAIPSSIMGWDGSMDGCYFNPPTMKRKRTIPKLPWRRLDAPLISVTAWFFWPAITLAQIIMYAVPVMFLSTSSAGH
ncbi:hypothetical protein B0T26DRAFT_308169 [Lasiosphaeria miniovina]|uniref:Uncharacterized protein n=1 Tax=Lasiosphaeria miniovina TaxID=1954250 RepID=A0AA40ALH4_9PEZI|nr:uncharacterized protein B0T26DRAFT_308169 [Lasiosphaeria miniovina]KAK0717912.1 hypothetical protein B0T26DRAFT_308169 [Lasiosphaeria miniovina]